MSKKGELSEDEGEESKTPQTPSISGGYGAVLSEQLEMFISCPYLPKSDVNPFIVISQKNDETSEFVELMKTEVVNGNRHPEFTKQIIIDYKFEELQLIRFDVYDAATESKNEYIGHCEFILSNLVTADGSELFMKLKDKHNNVLMNESDTDSPPMCMIRSEEVKQNFDEFQIQFSAKDLPKTMNNPYLQLYRHTNDGNGWMSIMRTKSIQNTLAPHWDKITVRVQRLCNNDYTRPILIKCFHEHDSIGAQWIGQCETSLQQLLDTESKTLVNPISTIDNKRGELLFADAEIITKHGFLSYISSGMQIQMIVAVDFTASNVDPKNPKSLHYIGPPNNESPYMRAIRSVGRVVGPYDSDGQIACYGFGANINPTGDKNVSHCFNLTLNDKQHEVEGIDGVLKAYKSCLSKIQLYGPTLFNKIVKTASEAAFEMENNEKEQNYVILLIITDGIINDMEKTIDAVVDATDLPLSIIVVGVGEADFSKMDKLDADDVPLESTKGVLMKRDIVQFVPFNKFSNAHISRLAKEVLEEVPDQVTGFMSMKRLNPIPQKITPGINSNNHEPMDDADDDMDDVKSESKTPFNYKKKISETKRKKVKTAKQIIQSKNDEIQIKLTKDGNIDKRTWEYKALKEIKDKHKGKKETK